jgi:hypothetical protein
MSGDLQMPVLTPLTQNVGYIDAAGNVHQLTSLLGTGTGSWDHANLTAVAVPAPPVEVSGLTSWADPVTQHVGFLDASGNVWELAAPFEGSSPPTWGSLNLTTKTEPDGATPAWPGGGVTSWDAQNWMGVVCTTPDEHLHVITGRIESPLIFFNQTDLMQAVPGIPLAGLGGAVVSWADLTWWHVVYLDVHWSVHHLSAPVGGGTWAIDDFLPGPGPQLADTVSPLTSWWDWSSAHVAFLRGAHVVELAYSFGGGTWTQTDLTEAASAPKPLSIAPLTSCADQENQHVFYVTSDGSLHQLSAPVGTQSWTHTPISAVAGAPPVPIFTGELGMSAMTGLTSWADSELTHVVYESANGALVQLFAPVGSTAWEFAPVTAAGAPPARPTSPLTSWVLPFATANLSVTIEPRPELDAVATYTFTVTDAANGSPVQHALVTVRNGPAGGESWQLTGANGKAEFPDLRLETIDVGTVDRHILTEPPSYTVKAIGFNSVGGDL